MPNSCLKALLRLIYATKLMGISDTAARLLKVDEQERAILI